MPWSRPVAAAALLAVLVVLASCGSAGGPDAVAPGAGEDAAAAAAVAPAASPEPADAASPAAAYVDDEAAQKRASQLFRAVCTGYCHTTAGAGREAPDLFDCANDHGGSDREIFEVIHGGVPNTQMQAFGGKLPDDDLWKIVAYLKANSTCSG